MGLPLKLINSKLFSVSEDNFLSEVSKEAGCTAKHCLTHNWFECSGLKETSGFNSEPLMAICMVLVWILRGGGKVQSFFCDRLIILFFSDKHWNQRSEWAVTSGGKNHKSNNSHFIAQRKILSSFSFLVKQKIRHLLAFWSPSFWQMKQEMCPE